MIHYDHAVHVVRKKRLSRTIPAQKPDKFFTHQNPSPYVDIVSMEETEPMPEPNDDRSRLDGAYRSEKPRLIARLRAAGRTLEEAEDLVHDVYAETMERLPATIRQVQGRDVIVLRDEVLPVLRLRDVVRMPRGESVLEEIVVIERGDRRAGLVVDELTGQEDIVVKSYDAVRDGMALFSGATILSDGAPALIVDVASLL